MIKALVLAVCTMATTAAIAQLKNVAQPSPPKAKGSIATSAQAHQVGAVDYSLPNSRGYQTLHVFADDPRPVFFDLVTSWVPGKDKKGELRFIVKSSVFDVPDEEQGDKPPVGGWGIPAVMGRLHNCEFKLVLYDQWGFVLEKVPLVFVGSVNEKSEVTELTANDFTQMDMQDYRNYLKAVEEKSWNLNWACSKLAR